MATTFGARSLQDLRRTLDTQLVRSFVNIDFGVLGRSVSTPSHPNTSGRFQFWLSLDAAEARVIDIGTIVVALTDDKRELVFGVVNELNSVSDADSFMDDYIKHDHGQPEESGLAETEEVIVATCAVIRTMSQKTRPVTRSRIYFPTALGIEFAFGAINADGESAYHGSAVPVGVYENADGTVAPVSIDENYLVGPEAAHLNVSGISGLACKTSALEFCLKSLLTHASRRIGVVVMNVKSKDLLYLDQLNPKANEDMWSKQVYESLGIPVEPFKSARFFAPANTRRGSGTRSLRELPTEPFHWDLQMLYQDLPALFHASDWNSNTEGAWYVIKTEIERGNIETYEGMISWIDKLLSQSGLTEWPRGFPTATWYKLKSDFKKFATQYRGLITEREVGADIPWHDMRRNQIFVVDIQMLSEGGQKLVFGRCVRAISSMLETNAVRLDSIVIMVDELNKFAPKDDHSGLKSQLVEVTARGRSLGLVLFGAEQFASAVDKQIVENSSTFMFGRTESTEMMTPNYASLTEEMKAKLRMLPQGQLLVKFPKFPQPIFVRFPYPPSLPGDDFRDSKDRKRDVEDDYVDQLERMHRRDMPIADEPVAPQHATPRFEAPSIVLGSSFLSRYQSGEYEPVWTEMMSIGLRIRETNHVEDARAVARETMRRVRHNLEIVIPRLDKMDYQFYTRTSEADVAKGGSALGGVKQMFQSMVGRSADHLKDRNVFLPATEADAAIAGELEETGILLPLSLRAWMETVGRVDLTGTHPKLCSMQVPESIRAVLTITWSDRNKTQHYLTSAVTTIGRAAGSDITLAEDDRVSKYHARISKDAEGRFIIHDLGSTNGVLVNNARLSDKRPLKAGDEILIGSTRMVYHQTAKEQKAPEKTIMYADPLVVYANAEAVKAVVDRNRKEKPRGPFEIFVSPYDADKAAANPVEAIVEGYAFTIPTAAADLIVKGERHNTTFVSYLRHAFKWGCFPGWDRYKTRPTEEIATLTKGLMPF